MKKLMNALVAVAVLWTVGCNDEKKTGETTTDSTTVTAAPDHTAVAQDTSMNSQTAPAGSDGMFAADAAQGGMAEVKLGQLALTNGTAGVKDLANMMVKDHSTANDELKALAAKMNLSLPAAMNDMQQKKYDELAAKKGNDFDKAYADAMVEDHEMDLNKFKEEAANGANADLKAWAQGKVPILSHHLQMAKDTKNKIK